MGDRNASEIEYLMNATAAKSKLPYLHWGPIVDGVSMNGTPQELVPAGKFNNKVPVIVGSNRDEFSAFLLGKQNPQLMNINADFRANMTETQFDDLFAYLGEANVKMVKRLYSPSVYTSPADLREFSQWWWTAMRIATDNGIPFEGWPTGPALGHCSARRITEQLLHGGTPSAYMYHFSRPRWFGSATGLVGHGLEIPFVFSASMLLQPGNQHLAFAMTSYWVNFATSGTPNLHNTTDTTGTLPHWP